MDEQKRKYHIRLLSRLLVNAADELRDKALQIDVSDNPLLSAFGPAFYKNPYLWSLAEEMDEIQDRLLTIYKTKGAGLDNLFQSDVAMLIPIMCEDADTFDLIPKEDWNELFKELLNALYPTKD